MVTACAFGVAMGVTWLGTVPLTNGLVAQIFGVKYLSTLFSIVFLGHQIGSFLGAWYGGLMFDLTGSYTVVWIFCVVLSVVAAAATLALAVVAVGLHAQAPAAAPPPDAIPSTEPEVPRP